MLISQTQLAIFIIHSHLFQAVHALVKTHHQTCITVLSQDGTIGAQLHQNGFLCDRTVQLEVSRSVLFSFYFFPMTLVLLPRFTNTTIPWQEKDPT